MRASLLAFPRLVTVLFALSLITLACTNLPVASAQDKRGTILVDWQRFLPGTDGTSVIQTSDGGLLSLGQNSSIFSWPTFSEAYTWPVIVKTDAQGNIVWARNYSLSTQQYGSSEMTIAVQTDDGYVLAGRDDQATLNATYLVKIDPKGNILWKKNYSPEIIWAITKTGDGGFAMAEETYTDAPSPPEFVVAKVDSAGNLLWQKGLESRYPPNDLNLTTFGTPSAIFQTADLGYVVVSTEGHYGPGSTPCQMFKLDSSGNVQWNQTYNQYYTMGVSSALALKDGYLLAGESASQGAPGYEGFLLRTDLQGNPMWNQTYTYYDMGSFIKSVSEDGGGFMFLGTATQGEGSQNIIWVASVDGVGQIQEQLAIPLGSQRPYASSIIQTSDGSHVFVGTWNFTDYEVLTREFWMVKISSTEIMPSVPEFGVQYVNGTYHVAPTYSTNPFTGQNVTVSSGTEVSNQTVRLTIKNQAFTSFKDALSGNSTDLYYSVRFKGHYVSNWTYYPNDPSVAGMARYILASNSDYTISTLPSWLFGDVPDGGQVDFQVQALTGTDYAVDGYSGGNKTIYYYFIGLEGDWSNTQTMAFSVGSKSTSISPSPTSFSPPPTLSPSFPTPSIPEFPTWITLPLLAFAGLLSYSFKRKGMEK